MDNKVKTLLFDILNAIHEIESFFEESPKEFFFFQNAIKTKRAVERNIEIIGEAMSRILNIEPSITITNSRKIVDTRNRIIHGYDTVSDEIIWSIVENYLPMLEVETKSFLANEL